MSGSAEQPTATVYGAGISGLTVAHELAEQGFAVAIVEESVAVDSHGVPRIAIGGVAATQYSVVEPPTEPNDAEVAIGARLTSNARLVEAFVEMAQHGSVGGPGCRGSIADFVAELAETRGPSVLIRVVGLPDACNAARSDSELAASLAARRASEVAEILAVDHGIDRDRVVIETCVDPLRLETRSGVLLTTGAVTLPGEHGYRFFPSFYRHMFNTMKRIPDGVDEGRCVLDNVRSCDDVTTLSPDRPAVVYPVARAKSVAAGLRQVSAGLRSTGASVSDLAILATRLLRFLSSSEARREDEYEDTSLLDCLLGSSRRGGPKLSSAASAFLREAPRILTALDPVSGDARTNLAVAAQLLWPDPGAPVNGTLDGPTSVALFDPWTRHLRSLGVTFLSGSLCSLAIDGDRLVVDARIRGSASDELPLWFSPASRSGVVADNADYIVIALGASAAERASARLPAVGVPARLEGYSSGVGKPAAAHASCDEDVWSRFRTIAGVQLFFAEEVEFASGHVYCSQTPWALSAIAPHTHWRKPPRVKSDGYAGMISIDVGDFGTPGTLVGRPASECTESEFAAEVWWQLREATRSTPGLSLPEPQWYHVDRFLTFDGPKGQLSNNSAPLQVPLVSDWIHRPGADVAGGRYPATIDRRIWRHDSGGYLVHWDRLVYAGTWKKTTTRLTTMESANESGRHAARAVLRHADARTATPPVGGRASVGPTAPQRHARCETWALESHEPPELAPLRVLDRELFRDRRPHLFDLLDVESHLQSWSAMGRDWPDAIANAAAALPTHLQVKLLHALRSLRTELESLTTTDRSVDE